MSLLRRCLLTCSLVLAACGGPAAGAPRPAPGATTVKISAPGGDWTRFDFDAQRSGVGPVETGITSGNLGLLRRRVVKIDGTADSSAIELHAIRASGRTHDLIVLTTSYGHTIALDGAGAKLWEYIPPGVGALQGGPQFTHASPVADPDRRYVYSASPDGRIHKLALATGREVRSGHWPASVTFDATREKLAGALNLSGRSVIAVTGGYLGDPSYYQGHVVLIDRSTGRVSHVWNSLCSDRRRLIDPPRSCPYPGNGGSAIWARAGAVVQPGSGRILVATGNAPFNGSTDWGDSVLELSPQARLLHNWTPTDQAQLNSDDADLGSTAPALLPEVAGRRLAVQGGKDGVLKLLDLDRLDGTRGGPGPRLGGELQRISAPGGGEVLTAPAVWRHAGRTYVLVANDKGSAAYVLGGGGRPRLDVAWQSATPGTSPVVAGGLLFAYDELDGQLEIRQPAGGRILASLPAGKGHWSTPIVVGGRIVLPEGNADDRPTSGIVDIYHLPGR
ncbi:MAG: hypothetical protein ACR2IP_05475 [Solirubrobacteraceae bacterium]